MKPAEEDGTVDSSSPNTGDLTGKALEPGGTGDIMIEIREVEKWYGDFQALTGVSLLVGRLETVVVA
jgi:hypothetical protein